MNKQRPSRILTSEPSKYFALLTLHIIPQKNQKSIGFHKKAPYGELFSFKDYVSDTL